MLTLSHPHSGHSIGALTFENGWSVQADFHTALASEVRAVPTRLMWVDASKITPAMEAERKTYMEHVKNAIMSDTEFALFIAEVAKREPIDDAAKSLAETNEMINKVLKR